MREKSGLCPQGTKGAVEGRYLGEFARSGSRELVQAFAPEVNMEEQVEGPRGGQGS